MQEIFSIQGIECDPSALKHCVAELVQVLRERCALITNPEKLFGIFIFYRVAADKDVAEKLYDKLKCEGFNPQPISRYGMSSCWRWLHRR